MIVIRRITHGMIDHFPQRVTEWGMAWPALGMGIALRMQPGMFQTSPSFSRLALVATQQTWALIVLLCCLARVIALVINGNFRTFPYTPHIRLAASLACLFFWSRYCLGFLDAALGHGGAWSGVIAYSTFVILELVNCYRSWLDVLRGRGGA